MNKCFLSLIAMGVVFLPLSPNAQADGCYYHHYYGYHDARCHEAYWYVGQCPSGCWYPDAHKVSLAHTVFHGRARRYDTTPEFTSRGHSSDNLSPLSGNLEAFPWRSKIAATVFWIGGKRPKTIRYQTPRVRGIRIGWLITAARMTQHEG